MIKNLKSSTRWGLVLWLLLAVGITLIEGGLTQLNEDVRQTLWLVIAIPITLFVASRYFRKTPSGVKDGLVLGIWFVIIAIILDMTIIVPVFYGGNYSSYWNSIIGVFGGFTVIVICTGIAARITKKK